MAWYVFQAIIKCLGGPSDCTEPMFQSGKNKNMESTNSTCNRCKARRTLHEIRLRLISQQLGEYVKTAGIENYKESGVGAEKSLPGTLKGSGAFTRQLHHIGMMKD